MKLIVKYDNEKETVDIKTIDNLKDELTNYYGPFIDDDDQYGIELFSNKDFDNLLINIEEYFVKSFFEIAKDYFLTLKKIMSLSNMEDIIKEIDHINSLLDKAGFSLAYEVEE